MDNADTAPATAPNRSQVAVSREDVTNFFNTTPELSYLDRVDEETGQKLPRKYLAVKGNQRVTMVALFFSSEYGILKTRDTGLLYHYEPGSPVAEPFPLDKAAPVIMSVFMTLWQEATADLVKKTYDTILCMPTLQEVDTVDNGVIKITDSLYWDAETASLKGEEELSQMGKFCFHRLCDTTAPQKNVEKIDTSSEDFKNAFDQAYDLAKSEIAFAQNGQNPVFDAAAAFVSPFKYVAEWASNAEEEVNSDKFNDLLKLFCIPLLKNKPLGTAIFVGESRNGKSVCEGLLTTIYGANNAANVALTKYDDTHINQSLKTAVINVSDEDGGKMDKGPKTIFRTASDHGILNLGKMYRDDARPFPASFVSYVAMNSMPDWGRGSDAEACINRSLIVSFDRSFKANDNSPVSFSAEHFTNYSVGALVGVLIAMAEYYSSNPMVFSDTMRLTQDSMREDAGNAFTYRDLLQKHVVAFSRFELVWQDYRNWCNESGLNYSTKDMLKFALRNWTRKPVYISEERRMKYLVNPDHPAKTVSYNKNNVILSVDSDTFVGSDKEQIGDYIENGGSAVWWLDMREQMLKEQGQQQGFKF